MSCLETRDGTRLYFDDWGTGKPVVFLSSAWLSSEMWEHQTLELTERGLRCIAYDRRGHGRSDRPWDGYDYDTLADDLATLIERLDLRDVTLVAHSMGGGEAVRYLSRHRSDRIARIALVAATAPFPMQTADNPDGVPLKMAEALVAERRHDRAKWFTENAVPFLGTNGIPVSPEYRQWLVQLCMQCSPRATSEVFRAAFGTDLRTEMRAITVPTLIIHGDADVFAPFPLCGKRSAQIVQNNRLIVYEGAGHGLFVTHRDRLNADLLAFISGRAQGA
jgi:pimeloyl-ACP methyl ester carboxylesterase